MTRYTAAALVLLLSGCIAPPSNARPLSGREAVLYQVAHDMGGAEVHCNRPGTLLVVDVSDTDERYVPAEWNGHYTWDSAGIELIYVRIGAPDRTVVHESYHSIRRCQLGRLDAGHEDSIWDDIGALQPSYWRWGGQAPRWLEPWLEGEE